MTLNLAQKFKMRQRVISKGISRVTPPPVTSSEDGYAMFEGLVFLMAFVVLAIYVFDSFTAIHTGIVNSIGARTYLFETLEHRANIRFTRYTDEGTYGSINDFGGIHQRFHAVNDEDQSTSDRKIRAVGRRLTQANDERQMNSGAQSASNKTAVIYVKEGYGICLDAACLGGS